MTRSFLQKLTRRIKEHGTILCVGIDPPLACPTTDDLRGSNRQQLLEDLHEKCVCLIRRTSDFVCCFKPNVAFFEQYGSGGMEVRFGLSDFEPSGISSLSSVSLQLV